MSSYTPQQLKKALVQAGFEVFRTRGDEIVLAERVRENLIMDSGVRIRATSPFEVRVVFRAQRSDFPSEEEGALFDRVRALAGPAVAEGFDELATAVLVVTDPVDDARTLDTHYEVVFAKRADDLDGALGCLKYALSVEKTATPRRDDA
jgi:hypothetical protein